MSDYVVPSYDKDGGLIEYLPYSEAIKI